VIRPAQLVRRKISECIALMPAESIGTIDPDFVTDVEAAIAGNREPLRSLFFSFHLQPVGASSYSRSRDTGTLFRPVQCGCCRPRGNRSRTNENHLRGAVFPDRLMASSKVTFSHNVRSGCSTRSGQSDDPKSAGNVSATYAQIVRASLSQTSPRHPNGSRTTGRRPAATRSPAGRCARRFTRCLASRVRREPSAPSVAEVAAVLCAGAVGHSVDLCDPPFCQCGPSSPRFKSG
jgi:hypothetical protein